MNAFLDRIYRVRWLLSLGTLVAFMVFVGTHWPGSLLLASVGMLFGSVTSVFMATAELRNQRKMLARKLLPQVLPPPQEDVVLTVEIHQDPEDGYLGATAYGYGRVVPTEPLSAVLRTAADLVDVVGPEGLSMLSDHLKKNRPDK